MAPVNIQMSPKELRFVIEAMEFRITSYEARLGEPLIGDDEASDIGNDVRFLKVVLQEMKKHLSD
jgi:hypothetical protein